MSNKLSFQKRNKVYILNNLEKDFLKTNQSLHTGISQTKEKSTQGAGVSALQSSRSLWVAKRAVQANCFPSRCMLHASLRLPAAYNSSGARSRRPYHRQTCTMSSYCMCLPAFSCFEAKHRLSPLILLCLICDRQTAIHIATNMLSSSFWRCNFFLQQILHWWQLCANEFLF